MSIFKSIISPMQNCDEIAVRFCKQLKVEVTETAVKKDITEHPDYPSLLSISDAFRSYKIDNISLKTTVDNLSTFPTPFIVQVKGEISQYNLFGVINEILPDNRFNWFNPEKKKNELIAKADFDSLFTGYVMLAEADKDSGEIDFKNKRKAEKHKGILNASFALAIPFILLVLSIYSIITKGLILSIFPISFAIITLVGAITGALLLLYEIDQHNPTLQKVCRGGEKTNCGAILNSKASHIFGFSWSSIGFTYFMGTLVTLMIGGLTDTNILSVVAFMNIVTLPYIIFSIYYQAKVAKQWCPLCLIVQTCLAIQFILSFWGEFHKTPTRSYILPLFVLLINCTIVFLFVHLLIPSIQKSKVTKELQHELARLKHNPDVFQALLEKERKINYPTDGLGIILGNPNGKIKLIKVCNPYCGPCAMAHSVIDEILENNPSLQVQVIFTATGKDNDRRTTLVKHLLAIANMNDSQLIRNAMDDWYINSKFDYSLFEQKYLNNDLDNQLSSIRKMSRWVENQGINYTPTFFINGYQLPETYLIADLKYFLSV